MIFAEAHFNAWPLLILFPVIGVAAFIIWMLFVIRKGGDARRMILRRLALGAIVSTALAVIGGAVISWSMHPDLSHDGFGRKFFDVPPFVPMLFGPGWKWIGWKWALADLAVFCLGVYAIYRLWSLYLRLRQPSD